MVHDWKSFLRMMLTPDWGSYLNSFSAPEDTFYSLLQNLQLLGVYTIHRTIWTYCSTTEKPSLNKLNFSNILRLNLISQYILSFCSTIDDFLHLSHIYIFNIFSSSSQSVPLFSLILFFHFVFNLLCPSHFSSILRLLHILNSHLAFCLYETLSYLPSCFLPQFCSYSVVCIYFFRTCSRGMNCSNILIKKRNKEIKNIYNSQRLWENGYVLCRFLVYACNEYRTTFSES